MNKLLVVLPLLALLTVGIVYTVSQNEDGNLEASTPTIQQWEACRVNAPICDNMNATQAGVNSVNLYSCYAAATNVSNLYSDVSATASANCLAWQKVYKRGIAQDVLPASYYACIQDCTPSAQASAYYYNNIFVPLYVKCGGSQ